MSVPRSYARPLLLPLKTGRRRALPRSHATRGGVIPVIPNFLKIVHSRAYRRIRQPKSGNAPSPRKYCTKSAICNKPLRVVGEAQIESHSLRQYFCFLTLDNRPDPHGRPRGNRTTRAHPGSESFARRRERQRRRQSEAKRRLGRDFNLLVSGQRASRKSCTSAH